MRNARVDLICEIIAMMILERGLSMSKFAIGDRVDKATDYHEGGVVVAVFPTDDGNFRYAVDLSLIHI